MGSGSKSRNFPAGCLSTAAGGTSSSRCAHMVETRLRPKLARSDVKTCVMWSMGFVLLGCFRGLLLLCISLAEECLVVMCTMASSMTSSIALSTVCLYIHAGQYLPAVVPQRNTCMRGESERSR